MVQNEEDLNEIKKKQRDNNATEDSDVENAATKHCSVYSVALDYESTVCRNCNNAEKICTARNTAFSGLQHQAKRMKITSGKSHPPAEIGANATVPIPYVDKAKESLRNVIAVVLNKNEDNL